MDLIIASIVFLFGITGCVVGIIMGRLLTMLEKSNTRIAATNKQLLIVVAGKEDKPEHALRALMASNKPPQGKLKGITTGKKKDEKKPANVNYELTIGKPNAL